MAKFKSSYPSTQLLDNENNPITPLVDIASIYKDVTSKSDARVMGGVDDKTVHDVTKIRIDDDETMFIDPKVWEESGKAKPLYVIVGCEEEDHTLKVRKVNLYQILEAFLESYHRLREADNKPLDDEDEVVLVENY